MSNKTATSPRQSNRKLIRMMVETSIMTALICVCAPFSIPIGPIPLSLATMAIYLTALLLSPLEATLATCLYIAIGALGLPVFSNFTGGFGKLIGVTGGFIIGYIPLALIAGLISHIPSKKLSILWQVLGLILGTSILYLIGTAWFCMITQNAIGPALSACVIPFLPGDTVKIVVAVVLAQLLLPLFKEVRISTDSSQESSSDT